MSRFHKAVAFLILIFGVVLLFFHDGMVTPAQNVLSDNIGQIGFMAQFSGSIEDCVN